MLQFLLMVYSKSVLELWSSRCFVIGCGELPELIQCSLCHRQQGAGPLLCMTDRNEAAEPRCGQNTTLNTALPQLHALQTPKTPSPFTFPQQIGCSTRPGTPPPLEFSGRRGSGEVCAPEADFHPERLPPLLSRDSLFQTHRGRSLQLYNAQLR